ncbi:MAG TPA: archaetidylserine decarboxylase [Methylocella sp.]|nr:archaetidylserine decarboxylase [Methylocella sp.]
MTLRSILANIAQQEDINFILTNRIPRRLATRFMSWFSRIEFPPVRDASIAVWRLFSDLDLSEAKKTRFKSMHDCFIRELKEGARPIDPDPSVLVSPCDGIVGASGRIKGTEVLQIKGLAYTLEELLDGRDLAAACRDGSYVTLRLQSSMYHRFHAPYDCRVKQVKHIPGDAWNVNPIALRRIEKLFCKNERAVIEVRLSRQDYPVTLVPVAAILVASIRLHCLDAPLTLQYNGPQLIPCDFPLAKGQEMGWFEQGSTIVVLAPEGFALTENIQEGSVIRMGQPLMRLP